MTHEKKSGSHLFSVRQCVFKCKIHLSQKLLFYFSKLCVCAPRINAWKWHMIKKIKITSFFCEPMHFKCKDSSLSKTFNLFVKIMRLCAAHKRMKITNNKIRITYFSVRLCVFNFKNSTLSRTFLLFVKIVRLCAAHKRMKVTYDKK